MKQKWNKRNEFFCSHPLSASSQGFPKSCKSSSSSWEISESNSWIASFLSKKARFSQMTVNSLWSFAFTSLQSLVVSPSLSLSLPFFHLLKKWLMTLPRSEVIYGQMTLISYWRIEFLTRIAAWNEQNIKTLALPSVI